MSGTELLRALVTQRLRAAAEDILLLFERSVTELLRNNYISSSGGPRGPQGPGADAPVLSEDTTGDRGETGETGESWSSEPLTQSHTSNTGDDSEKLSAQAVKEELKQEEELPFIVTVKTENDESELHHRLTETSAEGAGCSSQPLPSAGGGGAPDRPPPTRISVKNRRHQCPHCVKRFVRNAELQRHVLVHTGQRPFVCSVCGRGFRVVYQLQAHMRTHTGEKTCFCHVCNKGFSTKSLLTEHMRTHTGDRPFRCPVCGRGFTQRGNVTAHVRTHTGEKPYSCYLCNRCFTQKSTLDKHVATHRREQAGIQNSAYAQT